MSSGMIRLSGLAAMLGGVLGIVLTPILTYLWATYSDAYLYYGRAYFPVYLGCIAGLAGLYALRRGNLGLQGTEKLDTEKLVFGLTFVGLAVSLVGDILEYWGRSAGEDFTMVQMQGFGIEMLGLMLVLFGSVAFGLTYRRANILPTLVVWLLIAAGPGGILFSILLHVPSGTMLVFCCAWVVLGYLLLLGRVASADRPSRVSEANLLSSLAGPQRRRRTFTPLLHTSIIPAMPLTQPKRENSLMGHYFRVINMPGARLARRCGVSHSQVYMARTRNVGADNGMEGAIRECQLALLVGEPSRFGSGNYPRNVCRNAWETAVL